MTRPTPRRYAAIAALAIALAASATSSHAQPYALARTCTHGGGVAFAYAGPYVLGGTAGQPDAGALVSRTYSLMGGFWSGGHAPLAVGGGPGGGLEPPAGAPLAFAFHPARPNPAHGGVELRFDLSAETVVRLCVLDIQGRVVRTLADGTFPAGSHGRAWDGTDDGGHHLADGLYLARLEAGERRVVRKLVFIH